MEQKSVYERFSLLTPWFRDIIQAIKRECKNEHLRFDPHFVRKYLNGMPINHIGLEEMQTVYLQQLLAGNAELAAFIANRWVFRHMDIYRFFEAEFKNICSDFERVSCLDEEQSDSLITQALRHFSAELVFCFVVLNEVALSKNVFEALQRQALDAVSDRRQRDDREAEESAVRKLRDELEKTKTRYETKIQDLKKRHRKEIELLQREIMNLKKEYATVTT